MMNELVDIRKYKQELQNGKMYLNSIAGLATFSLSLVCLSFDNPQKVAMLCLPIVIGLIISMPRLTSVYQGKQLIKFAENQNDKKLIEEQIYRLTNNVESKRKFILDGAVFFYSIGIYGSILMGSNIIIHLVNG